MRCPWRQAQHASWTYSRDASTSSKEQASHSSSGSGSAGPNSCSMMNRRRWMPPLSRGSSLLGDQVRFSPTSVKKEGGGASAEPKDESIHGLENE